MNQQLRIGQQLGHYQLQRLLGQGGFADVYLGEHTHLKTQAAVKVLHTRLTDEDVQQFLQEAQTVARLLHPNIVRVLDFGLEHSFPYLVMDYAPNGTLRHFYPRGGRVPLRTVVSHTCQVAEALHYAHAQRLIHRDIKPENMLLGRNNEVLLSDFGIALVMQSSQMANMQNIAGTIAYMAPEQIQAHPLPASDQYSLAIVVYEWLCGVRPFQGTYTEVAIKHTMTPPPPLSSLIPDLSAEVEKVVMKALSKEPAGRFESVRAFAQAFEHASGLSGSSARMPRVVSPVLSLPGKGSFTQSTVSTQMQSPASDQSAATVSSPQGQELASAASPYKTEYQSSLQAQEMSNAASPYKTEYQSSLQAQEVSNTTSPYKTEYQSSLQSQQMLSSSPSTPLVGSSAPVQSDKYNNNNNPNTPIDLSVPKTEKRVSRRTLLVGGGIAGVAAIGGAVAWSLLSRSIDGTSPSSRLLESLNSSLHSQNRPQDNPPDGDQAMVTFSGHSALVWKARWSPDGRLIASGDQAGTLILWTAADGQSVYQARSSIQPPQSDDYPWSIDWLPQKDVEHVAVGFVDGTILVLDGEAKAKLASLDTPASPVVLVSWSPDGRYIAAGSENLVRIYSYPSWQLLRTFQEHTDAVKSLAWSPNGLLVASGSEDSTVLVWNPLTLRTRLRYTGHNDAVSALSWSYDSTRIVSISNQSGARLWNVSAGQTLGLYASSSGSTLTDVSWSHDDQSIALYNGQAEVVILNTAMKVVQTIKTGVAYSVSWSPDDTQLATANYDNKVRIWRIS